jgi:uncharacterized protein (TIGR02996 family)
VPVYFVYRCHYNAPSEKHVLRFEYDTVLDWAKTHFKPIVDEHEASRHAEEVLGGLHVYSFDSLFHYAAVNDVSPPRKMADVKEWFQLMYGGDSAKSGPHHIQVLTDDDELEMAVYVFDDHYRAAKPGKADFLLLDGWELPAGDSDEPLPKLPKTSAVTPKGDGEGSVFVVSLDADDSSNLSDRSEYGHGRRIDGVRVPDLVRYLLVHPNEEDYGALYVLREALEPLFRTRKGPEVGFRDAIRKNPADLTNWAAYSDWLVEHDLPPAGLHLLELALRAKEYSSGRANRDPKLDRVKVTEHAAQVSKHESRWPDPPIPSYRSHDTYAQFLFFDDRWAAAHPTLAAGILTFASRWDVLT